MSRRTRQSLYGVVVLAIVFIVFAMVLNHRGHGKVVASNTESSSDTDKTTGGGAPVVKPALAPTQVALLSSVTPGAPATRPAGGAAQLASHPLTPTVPNAITFGSDHGDTNSGTASPTALADAKTKIKAGDLLAGRKLLNDALLFGSLSPADTATAKAMIAEANQTLIFSPQRATNDSWVDGYSVRSGDLMQKIAFRCGLTADFLCNINGLPDPRKLRAGATIKVIQGPFHAVVTKHAFTMDLYLGSPGQKDSLFVTSYPVGLGKDNTTPTGNWIVEQRIPNPTYYSPRGEGVVAAGDPKNPLGKFWIALTGTDGQALGKTSYGIHGTIDPDSIGKMASMGCIRMRNEDVAQVFQMLVAGKSVVVVKD